MGNKAKWKLNKLTKSRKEITRIKESEEANSEGFLKLIDSKRNRTCRKYVCMRCRLNREKRRGNGESNFVEV